MKTKNIACKIKGIAYKNLNEQGMLAQVAQELKMYPMVHKNQKYFISTINKMSLVKGNIEDKYSILMKFLNNIAWRSRWFRDDAYLTNGTGYSHYKRFSFNYGFEVLKNAKALLGETYSFKLYNFWIKQNIFHILCKPSWCKRNELGGNTEEFEKAVHEFQGIMDRVKSDRACVDILKKAIREWDECPLDHDDYSNLRAHAAVRRMIKVYIDQRFKDNKYQVELYFRAIKYKGLGQEYVSDIYKINNERSRYLLIKYALTRKPVTKITNDWDGYENIPIIREAIEQIGIIENNKYRNNLLEIKKMILKNKSGALLKKGRMDLNNI